MQTWPPSLERKAETEARHEWVDGAVMETDSSSQEGMVTSPITVCELVTLKKSTRRYQAPAFIEDKLAGDAQIEHVHAGQPLDPCWLKDDGLADWVRPDRLAR